MNKKAILTPKEKHLLGNYIIEHCHTIENSQWAQWDDNDTDLTVANKLRAQIPRINNTHIRNMRIAFGLPFEPPRLVFIPPRKDYKLTDLDRLRDKVEALEAHVKSCDVRLRDYEARIAALEEKYTAPPENHNITYPAMAYAPRRDRKADEWSEDAAGRAVAEVIDPLLSKPPTTLSLYRKGKHHK